MEELWRENNIFYNVLCFLITENEKLFDRNDANLYWRTVFHMFSILHHMYIIVIAPTLDIENNPNPEISVLYVYKAAFLTGWNFVSTNLLHCFIAAYYWSARLSHSMMLYSL